MINKELITYIRQELGKELPRELIIELLRTRGGWDTKDIHEAFSVIEESLHPHNVEGMLLELPMPLKDTEEEK